MSMNEPDRNALIEGVVSISVASIEGDVHPASVEGRLSTDGIIGDAIIDGVIINRLVYPLYDDPIGYYVIPTLNQQELDSRERTMIDNVIVAPIPYDEEVNSAGGITAIIANPT